MSPSVTWDASFEVSPADTDEAKYGAIKIRQLKLAISERLELEQNFKTGTQPLGKAGKAAVAYLGTTTEINALTGMSVGALAFDSTLKTWKRYLASWDRMDIIPSGTKMLFYADVAPAGWTIDNTLDDKLVYVTKGSAAGGQVGGAAHTTGSWTISGFSSGSHTLTIAEMPAHTHTAGVAANNSFWGVDWGGCAASSTGSTGGGGGHTHTLTYTPGWRPAAYCCIICSKD